jgi:CDP-diacylglycerol--glycerol-3-phosphate 3-phosphatidyltransferase
VRLADKFTLARTLFAPVFFVLYQLSLFFNPRDERLSLYILVFLVAALACAELTDFFDGYFARKRGEVSDTGKLFDPFADALLHITTFFCFTSNNLMPPAVFMLIFWREFAQMFLRMISIKNGFAVAARGGGKLKTVVYIICGFYALLLQITWQAGLLDQALVAPRTVLTVLFYLCLVLSYLSFIDYLILFKQKVFRKR